MKISDKELDDLFSSKLNDLEIEPDAKVWENITTELDGKRKKKSIVPALRIAASIIVILSVGFLFLRKLEPIQNQLPKKAGKIVLQKQDPSKNQITSLDKKNNMLLLSAKNIVIKTASVKIKTKAIADKTYINTKPESKEISTQTLAQVKPGLEPENAAINIQSRVALVPDASISLKPQPETEVALQTLVNPHVLAAANIPVKTKHKRIRNIGDVVNLVMAKVDKRADKLIEFTDSDDGDESNVTGINLGLISIKKEK